MKFIYLLPVTACSTLRSLLAGISPNTRRYSSEWFWPKTPFFIASAMMSRSSCFGLPRSIRFSVPVALVYDLGPIPARLLFRILPIRLLKWWTGRAAVTRPFQMFVTAVA
ncbi:hypothetical protein D3C76_1425510 [compost metagenome]